MRENCGEILAINKDDEQWLAQFRTEEEAYQCMKYHSLNVFSYEVIDMGESL